MKKIIVFAFLPLLFIVVSCKEDAETVTTNTDQPSGNFTSQRMGSFMEQNSTGTTGVAKLGTDAEGTPFLYFGSNFKTDLHTGTVTIYLSTSDMYKADATNSKLVGLVPNNGEGYYKLDADVPAKFTHVILWCATASIPFGYAPLQ